MRKTTEKNLFLVRALTALSFVLGWFLLYIGALYFYFQSGDPVKTLAACYNNFPYLIGLYVAVAALLSVIAFWLSPKFYRPR